MKSFRELMNTIELHTLVESVLMELTFDPQRFINRLQGVAALVSRGSTDGEKAAAREALQRMVDKAQEQAKELDFVQAQRFLASVNNIAKNVTANSTNEPPKHPHEPQAKPNSMPKFKPGQWVFSANTFKVAKVIRSVGGDASYNVEYVDGQKRNVQATDLRAATQEEVDAAMAVRSATAQDEKSNGKFAQGDWVVCKVNKAIGQIVRPDGTKYLVKLLDGREIYVQASDLRAAHKEEANGQSNGQSQNQSLDFKIIKVAHYKDRSSNKVYGIIRRNGTFYTFWGRYGYTVAFKEYDSGYAAHAVFYTKIHKGYQDITYDMSQDVTAVINKCVTAGIRAQKI